MPCDNCFNGCVETTSDKCVKYTGIDYPELGIHNGDSLSTIESTLIDNLLKVIDGTGIEFTISAATICPLVQSFLPTSGNINLVDYITVLIKCVCSLQDQVTITSDKLDIIEGDYVISCLTGVTADSGTHDIVQAVIDKLCITSASLVTLTADLQTNYVKISELDTYIADYLSSTSTSTAIRNRMVPYAVVEYYGSLSNFNASGQGIGDWEQIYLCNGQNNTPDKRGRSPIGVVTGMGGGAYDPQVDPANPTNPNYSILSKGGTNRVTLTVNQIPNHTHAASSEISGAHTHTFTGYIEKNSNDGNGGEAAGFFGTVTTSSSGAHNHNITVAPTGAGESHANVHPVIACYYIMYIPNP